MVKMAVQNRTFDYLWKNRHNWCVSNKVQYFPFSIWRSSASAPSSVLAKQIWALGTNRLGRQLSASSWPKQADAIQRVNQIRYLLINWKYLKRFLKHQKGGQILTCSWQTIEAGGWETLKWCWKLCVDPLIWDEAWWMNGIKRAATLMKHPVHI